MVNATEYLDQNYPKGNRSQIIELDISHKSLEDKFNSTDFSDRIKITQNAITHFDVSDNAIFELDLSE
ncbi:30337_t:CDS:2, partial [Gigaspora margarita]